MRADQIGGPGNAAVADSLLHLRRPALRDGLACKVDNRVGIGQRLPRRLALRRVPRGTRTPPGMFVPACRLNT